MKIAKFGFSLFGINTYVVWDPATKDCAIIDPGMIETQEEEALTGFIEREGLHVTHLINTHLHIDHAIGNRFVSERYGVPVEAHPADAILGTRMRQQAEMFGLTAKVSDVEISTPLHDGDIIRIGEGELKVIHIPGHSPGGIVLYDEADKFIIAGDVIFRGSVGRTDLPGGDTAQLLGGIRDKLLPLPDDILLFPGHGDHTTVGYERTHNPFLS